MSTPPAGTAPAGARPTGTFTPAPGGAGLGRMVLAQARMEARLMLRNGEQLLLAIVIPVIVLVGGVAAADRLGITFEGHAPVDVLTPGVLALAVMSTAFTSVAIATGFERRYGVIKLLGSSPLPRHGLLLGKVLALLNVVALQLVVLVVVALALGWEPSLASPPRTVLGAGAHGRPGHRGLRRPSASSSPVRCAPRRPWRWPTSSTCSSWQVVAWCCRPAPTAPPAG